MFLHCKRYSRHVNLELECVRKPRLGGRSDFHSRTNHPTANGDDNDDGFEAGFTSFPLRSHSPSVTMSDDFVRLVSQANPALRQYQPANNPGSGYPPSTNSNRQQLDPFFDDEDDMPDSAFAPSRVDAMQSKESGLPLTRHAAPHAGTSQSTLQPEQDMLQWDDYTPQDSHTSQPFAGSSSFPGPSPSKPQEKFKKPAKKWKWPWNKEEERLEGERVIALNNSPANSAYCSNYVSTSKYNVATFLPKFFFGARSMFSLWYNCC